MGGSLGKNQSSNTSVSNPATVWNQQSPYLSTLYGQATMQKDIGNPYAQNLQAQTTNPLQQMLAGGVTPGAMNQYTSGSLTSPLAGLGFGHTNQNTQQPSPYTSDPRLGPLGGLAQGNTQNQALSGAIQAGLGDINRNFQQNIMPGINTGAAMTNTSGGSRQGIAQGLAASNANRQASDFVNRMQSQNYQSGLNAQLGALGQLGSLQGQQNQYNMGVNQMQSQDYQTAMNTQLGALNQLGGMQGDQNQFNLAMNQMQPQIAGMQNQNIMSALGLTPQLSNMGWDNQFNPLRNYGDLIGAPTVLGGGGASSGGSSGWNAGSGVMYGG